MRKIGPPSGIEQDAAICCAFTDKDRMDQQAYQTLISALTCIANPASPSDMRAMAEEKVKEFQEFDGSIDYAMTILTTQDPSKPFVR